MLNVVLAPHIGSATHEARASMAALAVLKGGRPPLLVNPEVQGVGPLREIKML